MGVMTEELNSLLDMAKELPDDDFKAGEFTQLPDGDYIGIIEEVCFTESKNKKLMFKWTILITEGEYKKRKEWKYNMLTSKEGMKWLTIDLKKFGVNTESEQSILEDAEKQMLDVEVKVTVKTNENDFRGIYVKPLK